MIFVLTFVALLATFLVCGLALTALLIMLGLLPGARFFQKHKFGDTQRVQIVYGEIIHGESGTRATSNNVMVIKVGPQIVELSVVGVVAGQVSVATDARLYPLEAELRP